MANTPEIDLKLPSTADNIAEQINIDTVDNLTKIDNAIKNDRQQINDLDTSKVNRLENDDFAMPTTPVSEYPQGLSVFRSMAQSWKDFTGIPFHHFIKTYKYNNDYVYQEISFYSRRDVIYRIAGTGGWTPFQTVLNNIKPNWLSATLQNGWTGIIYYRKNQIDLIEFQGSLTVGTLASGTIIATLPEGYRPSRATPIAAYVSTNSKVVSGLVLSNTGEFRVYAPATTELSSGNTISICKVLP